MRSNDEHRFAIAGGEGPDVPQIANPRVAVRRYIARRAIEQERSDLLALTVHRCARVDFRLRRKLRRTAAARDGNPCHVGSVLLFAALFLFCGCKTIDRRPPTAAPASRPTTQASMLQRFEFVEPKMGTVFRIVLYAPDEPRANEAAKAAFARVDELNGLLSDYDPKSEISRLSAMTDDGPMREAVAVGDDLWRVLEKSMEAARLSEGAFDVTLGPFTKLWRRSRDMHELPTPERLAVTRKSIGWEHVRLDAREHKAQLLAPKMRLDVGGIAKGYTAEQVVLVLKKLGIERALVGAAGDIAASDPPPGQDYWRVGIQSLEKPDEVAMYVRLRNNGVSTSGDTYRVIEIGGKRYSHIIDPATGVGMTSRIGVTVVAPSAFTSDWLSTAVSVMGPARGMALVERMPGTAVRIISIDEQGGRRVVESQGFAAFVANPPAGNDNLSPSAR